MKDLTFRIRQARRRATLSQAALACKVGVNRSAVAQWERPGGSSPTSANLAKIAIVTATQHEWLATGRGKMTLQHADGSDDSEATLVLQFYAHDEVEERLLIGLRKLEHWQSLVVAEMVEGLALGRLRGV